MSALQQEVYEAFRDMGAAEDKALEAAAALSKRDDDVSSLKADMAMMKWMMGFVLAFQVLIFGKMFVH